MSELDSQLGRLDKSVLAWAAPRISPGVWDASHLTKIHRVGSVVWVYFGDVECIGLDVNTVPALVAALVQAYQDDGVDRGIHAPFDTSTCTATWPSNDLNVHHYCVAAKGHPVPPGQPVRPLVHVCACGARHQELRTPGLLPREGHAHSPG